MCMQFPTKENAGIVAALLGGMQRMSFMCVFMQVSQRCLPQVNN